MNVMCDVTLPMSDVFGEEGMAANVPILLLMVLRLSVFNDMKAYKPDIKMKYPKMQIREIHPTVDTN